MVGAGLGGLLCATILAKEGMKVCLLEQNKQIGGCLQTFSLHKHVFDSCVHYIGGLGEGHTLNTIFRYAGIMDKLVLKELDKNGFDRVIFSGSPENYPLACGYSNFIEQLHPYFSGEKEALLQYTKLLQETADHFPLYNLRNGDASEKEAVVSRELSQTMAAITSNKRLQHVLTGNSLLYAGVAGITPFYLHALATGSYMHSAHKVVPGSSAISKHLWTEIQQQGGEIVRASEVKRIVATNGVLTYAETGNGIRYHAKQFIAAIHPERMLQLIDAPQIKPAFRRRIAGLPQTPSAFMVNIVLKPGTVTYRNHNIYHHTTDGTLLPAAAGSTLAIYFSEDNNLPGYAATVSLLGYMPYAEFAQWGTSHNTTVSPQERSGAYSEHKERIASKMISQAEQVIQNLRNCIVATSTASPLSFRDYTGTPEGALYGIMKNVHTPAATTIATRTSIPNLLLTGQNINLHGVLGVSITAVATCAELLGMDYLLKKLNDTRI